MDNKRQNRILEEVHETSHGLYRQGLIDKRRMGEFNALCNRGAEVRNTRWLEPLRRIK